MTAPTVDAELARILAANSEARLRHYDELFGRLTERERLIFREAAVSGFVQGTRAGITPESAFPGDREIVIRALACIDGNPDLYRTVSGYVEDAEDEDEDDD